MFCWNCMWYDRPRGSDPLQRGWCDWMGEQTSMYVAGCRYYEGRDNFGRADDYSGGDGGARESRDAQ